MTPEDRYVAVSVREWRQECGFSQYQLGELIGVSQKCVSGHEGRPLSSMRLYTLQRRADALRTDLVPCVMVGDEFSILVDLDAPVAHPRSMSLRQMRIRAGLTQREVAREARIDPSRPSQLETREIARATLGSLAEYLRGIPGALLYVCAVVSDGRVLVLRDEGGQTASL